MGRKLIFLDIDGTILSPGEGIHAVVQKGLQRARSKGHQVFICTGRSCCSLPDELKYMETDGIIANAGSDIWIHGQNIYRTSLDEELLSRTCGVLRKLDAIYVLEGFDRIYISEKGKRILLDEEPVPGDNPEIARWKQFFRRRKNVSDIREWTPKQAPVPKITFMVWDEKRVRYLKNALEKDFHIVFFERVSGAFYNGELISKNADKGTAICRTAEYLKADIRDTIAFGDSMNDYQMIAQAGIGIVMANGDAKLRAIADGVCESVQEDGVIRELARRGLL